MLPAEVSVKLPASDFLLLASAPPVSLSPSVVVVVIVELLNKVRLFTDTSEAVRFPAIFVSPAVWITVFAPKVIESLTSSPNCTVPVVLKLVSEEIVPPALKLMSPEVAVVVSVVIETEVVKSTLALCVIAMVFVFNGLVLKVVFPLFLFTSIFFHFMLFLWFFITIQT